MKARIVPKPLIEQTGLNGDVEVAVCGDTLVISPATQPRAGWAEAFRAMAQHGDDQLIDEAQPARWDKDEWRWR
jgi:antitoxin MazE